MSKGVICFLLQTLFLHIPSASEVALFPVENNSVVTRAETKTVIGQEVIAKGKVFQFFVHRKTKKKLFGIQIGRISNKKRVTFWNYGISREGDFNEDGKTDYSYFAGDDTSEISLLFLSHPSGHREINIQESVAREWKRLFPRAPKSDFQDFSSTTVTNVGLVKKGAAKVMNAKVVAQAQSGPVAPVERFLSIPEDRFVITRVH